MVKQYNKTLTRRSFHLCILSLSPLFPVEKKFHRASPPSRYWYKETQQEGSTVRYLFQLTRGKYSADNKLNKNYGTGTKNSVLVEASQSGTCAILIKQGAVRKRKTNQESSTKFLLPF